MSNVMREKHRSSQAPQGSHVCLPRCRRPGCSERPQLWPIWTKPRFLSHRPWSPMRQTPQRKSHSRTALWFPRSPRLRGMPAAALTGAVPSSQQQDGCLEALRSWSSGRRGLSHSHTKPTCPPSPRRQHAVWLCWRQLGAWPGDGRQPHYRLGSDTPSPAALHTLTVTPETR